jgi:hypothetical protein
MPLIWVDRRRSRAFRTACSTRCITPARALNQPFDETHSTVPAQVRCAERGPWGYTVRVTVGGVRASKRLVLSGIVAVGMVVSASGPAAVYAAGAVSGSTRPAASGNYVPLPRAEVREITGVASATLRAVGTGKRHGHRNRAPSLVKDDKLTKQGKPELAYIIGEFCPFCAGQSWSVAVALSRFGRFHGLTTLVSSADDDPASIQTMSFRYSRFHSRYVAYEPIVNEDVNRHHVESVPTKVRRAWHRYGPPGFPFIDFGGRAILNLPSFEPTVLKNLTRKQIAADLNHPKKAVAKAIDGSANQITAAICVMTNNKPARVCHTKTISTIRRTLRPLRSSAA